MQKQERESDAATNGERTPDKEVSVIHRNVFQTPPCAQKTAIARRWIGEDESHLPRLETDRIAICIDDAGGALHDSNTISGIDLSAGGDRAEAIPLVH